MQNRVVFSIVVIYCFSLSAQLDQKLGNLTSALNQVVFSLKTKQSSDVPPPFPPRGLTEDLSKKTFYEAVGILLHLDVRFVNTQEARKALSSWGVKFDNIPEDAIEFNLNLFVPKKEFKIQMEQAVDVAKTFPVKDYGSIVEYLKWYNLYPKAKDKAEEKELEAALRGIATRKK